MAKSSVPADISKYRPGPCTEIKLINGHYYVYMYSSTHLSSGNWGKKTGKSIGKILPDIGFVPNKNYYLYQGGEALDEITVLEYGQYALIEAVSADIKSALLKCFAEDKAYQIFAYACILFANDFVHIDQIQSFYEQSWLSQEYKKYSLKMGKTAIGNLLDNLGRLTQRPTNYEKKMISDASSMIAIDGHAIRSCSDENALAESGYKHILLKEDQVNLLMGYDIVSGVPLFARMFRGSCNDKSTIEDLNDLLGFSGILFVIDRGFYSSKNLSFFSANDNSYIIPVPSNTDAFKAAMSNIKYTDEFHFQSGKKHARIEYKTTRISDTEYVYVFRDIDENEKCRFNYQHSMELGKSGYTAERYEQNKEFFGVYVLQSNSSKTAKEVFECYKKRWGIETFYQYLKNKGDFNDLMLQDYYMEQGFSFIMLVAGQIHQRMISAVKSLKDNTISVRDLLLMARCMKMERRGNVWTLKNTRKKDLAILEKVGFIPQQSIPV